MVARFVLADWTAMPFEARRQSGRCKKVHLLFCTIFSTSPLAACLSVTLTKPTPVTRPVAPLKDEPSKKSPTSLQKLAFEIASTFDPAKFDPLITDRHVQTIGGFFLRHTPAAYLPRDKPIESAKRILGGIRQTREKATQPKQAFWHVRETVETPDGDFFHADTKFAADETAPMVIMLHGLESNSDSELSKQLASACVANGMSFTCVNFRSCSEDEHGNLIPNAKLWGCKWARLNRCHWMVDTPPCFLPYLIVVP